MKVFVSYAQGDRELAEALARELEREGHEVFFDKEDIREGGAHNKIIRDWLKKTEYLVFLASKDSIATKHYARSELLIFKERFPDPESRVFTYCGEGVTVAELPTYLKSVSAVTEILGDPVATLSHKILGSLRRLVESGTNHRAAVQAGPSDSTGPSPSGLSKLLSSRGFKWAAGLVVALTLTAWIYFFSKQQEEAIVRARSTCTVFMQALAEGGASSGEQRFAVESVASLCVTPFQFGSDNPLETEAALRSHFAQLFQDARQAEAFNPGTVKNQTYVKAVHLIRGATKAKADGSLTRQLEGIDTNTMPDEEDFRQRAPNDVDFDVLAILELPSIPKDKHQAALFYLRDVGNHFKLAGIKLE